jgi:malonate transporter and related proteins
MSILVAFEPIWILTAAGYLARRNGLLGDTAASVLGRFVFHLAMPAALFLTLDVTPLSRFGVRPLLAFGASTAVAVAVGWYGARRWFGRKPGEQPIWGMSAGYVNSANLGIPIAKQILGNISFLAEVVLLQVLIVTPIILTALDRHGDGGRVKFRRIATLPVRNPVILGSALGVVCSAAGLRPPSVLAQPLGLLSASAVPVALIALGASLHNPESVRREERRFNVGYLEISAVTALKLFAQPAIALCVGLLLHLSHLDLLAVVICAGLPTAQNTFIFAQEYGAAEALASRAVIVTTTFSLLTLAAAAALLGR